MMRFAVFGVVVLCVVCLGYGRLGNGPMIVFCVSASFVRVIV